MICEQTKALIRNHMTKRFRPMGNAVPDYAIQLLEGTLELKHDLPNVQYWQIRKALTALGLWKKEFEFKLTF